MKRSGREFRFKVVSDEFAKLQPMSAPVLPEPSEVYPESAFESAIAEVVHALLDGSVSHLIRALR